MASIKAEKLFSWAKFTADLILLSVNPRQMSWSFYLYDFAFNFYMNKGDCYIFSEQTYSSSGSGTLLQ